MKMLAVFSVVLAASPMTSNGQVLDAKKTSLIDQEAYERELAFQMAPIKSAADLSDYLAKNKGKTTPLSALSPGAQQRFLKSLMFTEKGLATFAYPDLRAELTASQIYQILSLFGSQRSINAIKGMSGTTQADRLIINANQLAPNSTITPYTDYSDYECEARGTCSWMQFKICTSNC